MTTEQPGADQPPTQFFLAQPPHPVPDVYTDAFRMVASAYTVALHFSVQLDQKIIQDTAIVRMSPQHAKMMAILFVRQMKDYEQKVGDIDIPEKILADKGIDLARDWHAI